MGSTSSWIGSKDIREICCIGAGFVGGSTGAVLASQLQHINVTVVDINQGRIDAWNSNKLPISEPGLDELVDLCRVSDLQPCQLNDAPAKDIPSSLLFNDNAVPEAGSPRRANLRFTTDVDESIRKADLVFACVDTPSTPNEGGLGSPLCTKSLEKAVQRVGEIAEKNFILVEKCTVPCGTAKQIQTILSRTVRPGVSFEVLSNPEFLAEGSAVQDLLHPNRVLVGSFPTEAGMAAAQKLAGLYEQWVARDKILTVDTWSSELSKLAANALLAQRISSINSLTSICESMDADIRLVSKACSLDERIGPHMLNASVGFGGSCFHKDITYLIYLAASLGLEQVARYWQAVLDMNDYQQSRFSSRIKNSLSNIKPSEAKVAILGFAFKAKTNDSRNSAAIRVVKELIADGFGVAIYDPCVAEEQIWTDLSEGLNPASSLTRVTVCSSPYEACSGANAVATLTEWDAFRYPPAEKRKSGPTMQDDGPPTPDSLDTPELRGMDEVKIADDSDDLAMSPSNDLQHTRSNGSSKKRNSTHDIALDVQNANNTTHKPNPWKRRKTSSSDHQFQPAMQWDHVATLMQAPKQIFDGRNIIADDIIELGFRIERIGKMSSGR